jgi:triacylglycerol lipase
VLAACALAAAFACAIATTAAAAPPYSVRYSLDPGLAAQGAAPDSPPLGANDFTCKPSEEHPNPVVLVHGLLANQTVNFSTLAPLLANDGYCVFSLTYGTKEGLTSLGKAIYNPGGLGKMETSAARLSEFVDRVLSATGAGKVDIVGHSEGSLMPDYYVKYYGGNRKVDKYVGLTTLWNGTNLLGLASIATLGDAFGVTPRVDQALGSICESCREFLTGSNFMAQINAGGGPADPAVTYTNIVTTYDELVFPYTSGLMAPGPNVTNHVVQDYCATDLAEHLAVVFDPTATTLISNALDPAHARPVPCQVTLPALGAPQAQAPAPLDSNGDGTPDYADVQRGS